MLTALYLVESQCPTLYAAYVSSNAWPCLVNSFKAQSSSLTMQTTMPKRTKSHYRFLSAAGGLCILVESMHKLMDQLEL